MPRKNSLRQVVNQGLNFTFGILFTYLMNFQTRSCLRCGLTWKNHQKQNNWEKSLFSTQNARNYVLQCHRNRSKCMNSSPEWSILSKDFNFPKKCPPSFHSNLLPGYPLYPPTSSSRWMWSYTDSCRVTKTFFCQEIVGTLIAKIIENRH